jgi:hypothetical protein
MPKPETRFLVESFLIQIFDSLFVVAFCALQKKEGFYG